MALAQQYESIRATARNLIHVARLLEAESNPFPGQEAERQTSWSDASSSASSDQPVITAQEGLSKRYGEWAGSRP